MNVLVAGGAGLLGAAVARALLAEGTDVVVADDFGERGDGTVVKEWRVQRLGADARLAVERADLSDAAVLADLFGRRRPAAVVNAALFDPAGPGAGALMRAARTAGTGLFVHLSDGALYAPGPEPERPAREDEPLDAGGEAGLASKLEEERHLAELGLPSVTLRLFEVLGPMFPPRRFPVEPLEAILAGEEVLYEASGWRDVVHIDDAVRGILLSLRRRPIGMAVNLGGGLLVNPRTLIALLAREAGRELRIRVTPPPGPLRPRRPANLERVRTELAWAPALTVGGIVESLVSARLGHRPRSGRAPGKPAREPAARHREPARAVSRRELFGLFRRPFRGPGR